MDASLQDSTVAVRFDSCLGTHQLLSRHRMCVSSMPLAAKHVIGVARQVYSLTINSWVWREHTPDVDGGIPSARYGHACAGAMQFPPGVLTCLCLFPLLQLMRVQTLGRVLTTRQFNACANVFMFLLSPWR